MTKWGKTLSSYMYHHWGPGGEECRVLEESMTVNCVSMPILMFYVRKVKNTYSVWGSWGLLMLTKHWWLCFINLLFSHCCGFRWFAGFGIAVWKTKTLLPGSWSTVARSQLLRKKCGIKLQLLVKMLMITKGVASEYLCEKLRPYVEKDSCCFACFWCAQCLLPLMRFWCLWLVLLF